MTNASYVALANQAALQRQLDVVANNLANANTTGFKSSQLLFTQYLANVPNHDQQPIAFPQDFGVERNFQEGAIGTTGNPLDLAIKGDAFFVVNTAAGQRYTGDGAFTLDAQGEIIDHSGDQVLDERGNPIVVPPNQSHVTISDDGTISTESGQLAHLALVRFDNPQQLKEESAGIYDAQGAQSRPASGVKVVQGSLEGSNVEPVLEMTHLIEISRRYEQCQNMLNSEDDRQKKAIETLGSQA